jgi:hypothetical protein
MVEDTNKRLIDEYNQSMLDELRAKLALFAERYLPILAPNSKEFEANRDNYIAAGALPAAIQPTFTALASSNEGGPIISVAPVFLQYFQLEASSLYEHGLMVLPALREVF